MTCCSNSWKEPCCASLTSSLSSSPWNVSSSGLGQCQWHRLRDFSSFLMPFVEESSGDQQFWLERTTRPAVLLECF